MSSKHAPIAGLDRLRSLAIILVFLFHYRLFPHPDWVDTLGSFGWTGVDLFFVLSGYLIAGQIFQQLQQQRFSAQVFFIKRAFRILPAYWVVLGLYFLVPGFREWGQPAPLWKFLSFTQNIGLDLSRHRAFSHAWSLCIEEQFYLLLPLVAWAVYRFANRRAGAGILVLLFLAGFGLRAWSWQHFIAPELADGAYGFTWYRWIYYPSWNRLDGLLAGISIAAVFRFYPDLGSRWLRYGTVSLGLGLALLTGAYLLCADPFSFTASVYGFPLVALGYGLLLVAALSPGTVMGRPLNRLGTWTATLSYALYLSHKAAIHLVQDWGSRWQLAPDSGWMMACCVAACLLMALALHFIIERPFLRLREGLLRRAAAKTGIAAS